MFNSLVDKHWSRKQPKFILSCVQHLVFSKSALHGAGPFSGILNVRTLCLLLKLYGKEKVAMQGG